MLTRIVALAEVPPTPWKNGTGTTRELARGGEGPEGWGWRLSVADVASDSEFSAFPGCDRSLSLLEGAGLILECSGQRARRLTKPLATLRFTGEQTTRARLVEGPTVDFNVMTQRASFHHEVATLIPGLRLNPAPVVALLVLSGELKEPLEVRAGQFALLEDVGEPLFVEGVAQGLVVRIERL